METPEISGFKAQAKRLRDYLAAAGVELKHTNALEAVAQMHGEKDWHTLANRRPPVGGDEDDFFIVQHGMNNVGLWHCKGRGLAIRAFAQEALTVVDLFESHSAKLTLVGQDMDLSLPLLALLDEDAAPLVTLQSAYVPTENTVVAGKFVPTKPVSLFGLEKEENYYSIGVALQRAISARRPADYGQRFERVRHGLSARTMGMNFAGVMGHLSKETLKSVKPVVPEIEPLALLAAMDSLKMMLTAMAVVRDGEIRMGG